MCRRLCRRPAEHPHLPRLPGHARGPPGAEPRCDRGHRPHRPGAVLRDPAVQQVRPQELSLPRPPQRLPDLPVRPAPLHGRVPRGHDRRPGQAHRHPARAPRGGHCQDDPRRRRQPDRFQPRRRAAHGDRHRVGPAYGGGGLRVPHPPAHDPPLPGREHGEHGGGRHALRGERLHPPARRRGPGDQGGGQEPELFSLGAAGDEYEVERQARVLGGAAGTGDHGLGRALPTHGVPALEGRGAGLPLLSRAGHPRSTPTREWVEGLPPSRAPDAKRVRLVAEYGLRADDAALLVEDRAVADWFEEAVAEAGGDVSPRRWRTGHLARSSASCARGIEIGASRPPPRTWPR